jgi:hypothetical protein
VHGGVATFDANPLLKKLQYDPTYESLRTRLQDIGVYDDLVGLLQGLAAAGQKIVAISSEFHPGRLQGSPALGRQPGELTTQVKELYAGQRQALGEAPTSPPLLDLVASIGGGAGVLSVTNGHPLGATTWTGAALAFPAVLARLSLTEPGQRLTARLLEQRLVIDPQVHRVLELGTRAVLTQPPATAMPTK